MMGILQSVIKSISEFLESKGLVNIEKREPIWSRNDVYLPNVVYNGDEQLKEKIIKVIETGIKKKMTQQQLAMELFDGYNSGKGYLREVDIPLPLDTLVKMSLNDTIDKSDSHFLIAKGRSEKLIAGITNQYLKASYIDLVEACVNEKKRRIAKAAWVAVQETTRDYAQGIASMEIGKSHFLKELKRNKRKKEFWGYKIVSKEDNEYDICNFITDLDIGYGKGLYPLQFMPVVPLHPYCLCYVEDVFNYEVKKFFGCDNQNIKKYINNLSNDKKEIIFGKEGLKKYNTEGNWINSIKGNIVFYDFT